MSRITDIANCVSVIVALSLTSARAQLISTPDRGSYGICATSLLNNPEVIREAWTNTELQHPGILQAMQQWRLQKGELSYNVGDQNLFWVYNLQNKSFDTVRAELKAVGSISYVWVALQEWNNGHVSQTEVDAMLNALEHTTRSSSLDPAKGILQIDRQVYGDPPNINSSFQKGKGDGKTHFLVCDIQDGWKNSGSYVAGFFFSVDVDPLSGAVPNSNRRDILYIDSYPGIYNNGSRQVNVALETLAHEFQHLIHWNYDPFEITFFNEGCSQYAEYLCGYGLMSPTGYFANTNVTLTGWETTTDVLDDYGRATLWTRYVGEQYGLGFIRNFVQNPTNGTPGFDQSLTQSGFSTTFARTMVNFFTANWMGATAPDSADRYKGPVDGKPALRGNYIDPNVRHVDTLVQEGVQYYSFASARNLRVTFTAPSNVAIRAVESGPGAVQIRDVTTGVQFTSPGLGTQYTSIVFVVMNTHPTLPATYSFTAAGDLAHFLVEQSYDSGTPHAYTQGRPGYVGFTNTTGMAVKFQPDVAGNILRKARLLVGFNQELYTSPSVNKDIIFHVWGDQNGRPGPDLIPPFQVNVDRNLFPLGSFVDIDLSNYQNLLSNLKGPVYVGFIDDANNSIGAFCAVDNYVPDDHSFLHAGPNYPGTPNSWLTMRELSAGNNHILDGFNLMIRDVFEYVDSSAAPPLTLGYLQNPLLSEYIDVVVASTANLRLGSLTGTITQGTTVTPLQFSNVQGTNRVFLDTTQQLKGSGTVAIRVQGAKLYGTRYSDTTISLNARLLKSSESSTLTTPLGNLTVSFNRGSVPTDTYITAFDGAGDSQSLPVEAPTPQEVFSIGPTGARLVGASQVTVRNLSGPDTLTLAEIENGRWVAIPSLFDRASASLTAEINRLGMFGVFRKSDVGGAISTLPTQFALYQNYPNPFNPSTTIEFDLPQASRVQLTIYNILGKEVSRLVDGERAAGHYVVHFDASLTSSGVYFYRLQAGGFTMTRKFLVVR